MAELSKHNSEKSCWTLIDGIVYDITFYITRHPGGKHTIIRGAGMESSEMFRKHHKGVDVKTTYAARFAIGKICEKEEDQTWTGKMTLKQQLAQLGF